MQWLSFQMGIDFSTPIHNERINLFTLSIHHKPGQWLHLGQHHYLLGEAQASGMISGASGGTSFLLLSFSPPLQPCLYFGWKISIILAIHETNIRQRIWQNIEFWSHPLDKLVFESAWDRLAGSSFAALLEKAYFNILQHQLASITINQHQSESISINHHQSTSISINL